MKSSWNFIALGLTAACAITTVVGCGSDAGATLNKFDAAMGSQQALSSPKCDAIWQKLDADREVLAKTQEWHDLTQTQEWADFEHDLQDLKDNDCKVAEKKPSDDCMAIKHRMHAHWEAVKTTDAYHIAEKTSQWQEVREGYKQARENHCWTEHPDIEIAQ